MFELKLIIFLLFAILVIVGLPLLSIKFFRCKGNRKLVFLLPALLWLFIVYNMLIAIFPKESFYVEEFEKNTGHPFPKSGKFLLKDASYPDIHGDYIARAVVQLSETDYLNLQNSFVNDTLISVDTSSFPLLTNTSNLLKFDNVGLKNINIVYIVLKKTQIKVGFMTDKKTIVFERAG